MHLTEIKNDFVTISYSPEIDRLMLSDFILVEDTNQSILAQVVSIEATMDENVNSAMLKFLLSIDKDANLTQYTGYVPAKGATLIVVNPQEVIQLIRSSDKNVTMGNLVSYPDVAVDVSLDFLRKRPYIQVDFIENKLYLVENIIKGLEKHNRKTVLIDFMGLYSGISLPTVTLGYNFKLPLNYDALCYIAEEELNDCSNENKAIIQGILIEVQNYVRSIEDEFIPFDSLISVLDAQYSETPMPELLLLKNKLLKYQQQGIFAQEKAEFDFLDTFLKDAKNFKFDLSELPVSWHRIAFISILSLLKSKCYLITDFTDENSNKSVIKKLYEKTDIKPIVISSYNYKYQLQLKALSKNLVLFKPTQKVNDFAGYTSFLNILSLDNFIIWGEQTLFIPLILKLQSLSLNEVQFSKKVEIEKPKVNADTDIIKKDVEVAPEKIVEKHQDNIDEDNSITFESVEFIDEVQEDIGDIEVIGDNITELSDNQQESIEDIKSIDVVDENQNDATTISDDIKNMDEEIVLDDIASQDVDVLADTHEQDMTVVDTVDEVETQDSNPDNEDLDFFFDEENSEVEVQAENIESNNVQQPIENVLAEDGDDGVIENLDEINIDDSLGQEVSPLENNEDIELKKGDKVDAVNPENFNNEQQQATPEDTQPSAAIPETDPGLNSPAVPVYKSNVAPQIDTKFAQGTYVHHPKYGRGVVEKIINYGAKNLCLIVFDDVGRRLLDPNVAELEQI